MDGKVIAVHVNASHTFSKQSVRQIMLLEGLGVKGDAHCGATVKHRSRVARDPTQPNLRQVHLMHGELFDELFEKAFRHNVLDLLHLKRRGLSLRLRRTEGSEPQLRRAGRETV